MSKKDNDFIGFSFNGVKFPSEDVGHILRVSSGDRYIDNLGPDFNDRTIEVPGGDKTYYFGSDITSKNFDIDIAFDNITEAQFRKLRQVLNTKEICPLIFDETPYKYYLVKCDTPPQFEYICFWEEDKRVYKGEGTISFIGYYPFAKSQFKFLEEYENFRLNNPSIFEEENIEVNEDIPRVYEGWELGSFMKEQQGYYDIYTEENNEYIIPLYNAGDLEAPCKIKISPGIGFNCDVKIELYDNENNLLDFISIEGTPELEEDNGGVLINSKNNIIYEIEQNMKTKRIYNKYIKNGNFFHIPLGESKLKFIWSDSEVTLEDIEVNIDYEYLYY